MKNVLCLTIENSEITASLFLKLSKDGYNATILTAKSLKHMLNDPHADDKMFINLRQLNNPDYSEHSFCYFIVEDKELNALLEIIREETKNFTLVKGGMYHYKLENYEGSF